MAWLFMVCQHAADEPEANREREGERARVCPVSIVIAVAVGTIVCSRQCPPYIDSKASQLTTRRVEELLLQV